MPQAIRGTLCKTAWLYNINTFNLLSTPCDSDTPLLPIDVSKSRPSGIPYFLIKPRGGGEKKVTNLWAMEKVDYRNTFPDGTGFSFATIVAPISHLRAYAANQLSMWSTWGWNRASIIPSPGKRRPRFRFNVHTRSRHCVQMHWFRQRMSGRGEEPYLTQLQPITWFALYFTSSTLRLVTHRNAFRGPVVHQR